MKIYFATKKENNRRREREFLKLSGGERVMSSIKLSQSIQKFPTVAVNKNKDNFYIVKDE